MISWGCPSNFTDDTRSQLIHVRNEPYRATETAMNGYEALAMTLALVDKGMDPNDAADTAIETMNAVNSLGGESIADAA